MVEGQEVRRDLQSVLLRRRAGRRLGGARREGALGPAPAGFWMTVGAVG